MGSVAHDHGAAQSQNDRRRQRTRSAEKFRQQDFDSTHREREQEPERIKENLQVLKRAAGFLRSQIAKRIKLRHVPELRFHFDESVVRGQQLSSLIDEAVTTDHARYQNDDDDDYQDAGQDSASDGDAQQSEETR